MLLQTIPSHVGFTFWKQGCEVHQENSVLIVESEAIIGNMISDKMCDLAVQKSKISLWLYQQNILNAKWDLWAVLTMCSASLPLDYLDYCTILTMITVIWILLMNRWDSCTFWLRPSNLKCIAHFDESYSVSKLCVRANWGFHCCAGGCL